MSWSILAALMAGTILGFFIAAILACGKRREVEETAAALADAALAVVRCYRDNDGDLEAEIDRLETVAKQCLNVL